MVVVRVTRAVALTDTQISERAKNIVFFILEQVILAFLVLTFCSCVLSNGLSLDDHFRRGLGVTLAGLAYLTGHAVYLTAMKLPGTTAPAAVEAAAINPANEPEETEAERSTPPQTVINIGKGWSLLKILAPEVITNRIIPGRAGRGNRTVVLGLTDVGGGTDSPVVVNAGSYGTGGVTFVPSGTAAEGGATGGSTSFVVAEGASAGGGPALVWDTTYPYQGNRVSSWNNQRNRHVGPGPRMLTEAQMKNTTNLLKTKSRQDVLIVTIAGQGDAPMVADQLTEAFSRAGWDVFVETSETRSINSVNVGQGVHFVGKDTDHESVRIAWNALKDTPVIPASIVPLPWKTTAPGSDRPQMGPPLTIVIGTP